VVVVDVAAVGVAVVPILKAFVGSSLHYGALPAAGCLMATTTAVSAAVAATAVVKTSVGSTAVGIVVVTTPSAMIVCLLLACMNRVGGLLLLLLLHGHAVLLHHTELALEQRDCRPLCLNAFLSGCMSCTEVCHGFAVQVDGGVIMVDSSHPISV
jgi:hypothetical protein